MRKCGSLFFGFHLDFETWGQNISYLGACILSYLGALILFSLSSFDTLTFSSS